MASEESGELSVTVPPEVREWLDNQAAGGGADRETVLRRLVESHYAVERMENGDRAHVAEHVDPDGVPAAVEERLDEIDDEFMDLIEDVRERVIQVKREADAKAPADHGHPDLASRVDGAAATADRLADEVDRLKDRVDEVDRRVEAGFENYEDVLEYLTDATDDLQERTDLLARAVVDVRREVRRLAGEAATRSEADSLKRAANRSGVRTASCGDCDAEVDVALLTAPKCPHCASTFNDVEPKRGIFGSATLATGDPPALEGRVETDLDSSLDDLVTGGDDRGEPDGTGSHGVDGGDGR
ncbi:MULTISPECIES: hypothetical protein [Halostella]|uniref:hypothetical protein n=1 Tax=Halostella TaxID=1843185 RepID=UPI0018787551|nr:MULTISPECIES: hypothetical protein [Halostella]